MKRIDWQRLASAADADPGFARRLLDQPKATASALGIEFNESDVAVLRAFADGVPSPESIAEFGDSNVELMLAVNH